MRVFGDWRGWRGLRGMGRLGGEGRCITGNHVGLALEQNRGPKCYRNRISET